MAEAEDVLQDAARHATIYVRELWHRNRPAKPVPAVELLSVAQRLDLLIAAVFRVSLPIRVAPIPAPRNVLRRLYQRGEGPQPVDAVPATDGSALWLPKRLETEDLQRGIEQYRVLALQQAARAVRGSAALLPAIDDPLQRDCYLLLEAAAADRLLSTTLPGLVSALERSRRAALAKRPALHTLCPARRPLENMLCTLLAADCRALPAGWEIPARPADSLRRARTMAGDIRRSLGNARPPRGVWLLPDLWTGELRLPSSTDSVIVTSERNDEPDEGPPRSARMSRRPEVREAVRGEDDEKEPGAWMIQSGEPLEQVEDPLGMQRPTDRDESTAADDFADALSELPEARLVTTPGSPKEVLLADDAPPARTHQLATQSVNSNGIWYPEWDYRLAAYRDPGARVHLSPCAPGDLAWVERTLTEHRSMLLAICRQFAMLRARRSRLRRQPDGEEIDLDSYTEAYADFRAGRPLSQNLYETIRPARRDTAIALLIDISGSTDSWIAAQRRIIDVEREALLLVCMALESLGEPYTVQAFSGEGPQGVQVRSIKTFEEIYSAEVARRIAGLEPERYTRAGAALRHTTALLMQQAAHHRLLLLLSDGKPNDADEYEGRYGVEDMRQAVVEAKLQGISPFCLTIDRQAAGYLPQVFGEGHYALLMRPEALPSVLIDWIRRLVTR